MMVTIVLSSQMNLYYNMRNVFLAVFAVLTVTGVIYGVRVHIVRIMQKHFGIEKRREIARMKEGEGHGRKTSSQLRAVQHNGKKAASGAIAASREIDISRVNTMKLQPEQKPAEEGIGTVVLREEPCRTGSGEEPERASTEEMPGTMVLGRIDETMVLDPQETVVLNQDQSGEIRKKRNVVLVHGEDIF